jgi:hypothetical protein
MYTHTAINFSPKKQYVQVILALEFFFQKNESTMSRLRVFNSLL